MSANGDLQFIASKVSEIDRALKAANDSRMDAFTGLLSSIETSLAEMLENIEKGGGAAAITAMADALKSLRMPEVNYTAPTIAPVFNVPPAEVPTLPPLVLSETSVRALALALGDLQVNVEAVMPTSAAPTTVFNAPRVKAWELRVKGQYGGADKVMTITPTYNEES